MKIGLEHWEWKQRTGECKEQQWQRLGSKPTPVGRVEIQKNPKPGTHRTGGVKQAEGPRSDAGTEPGARDRDGEREHKSTATTKVRKIQSRIEYQSEIQKHPNPFQKNKKWQNLQSRGLVSKSPGRDQAGVESTKNQSGLTLEARSLTSVAAVEGWRCCLNRGETRCNERE